MGRRGGRRLSIFKHASYRDSGASPHGVRMYILLTRLYRLYRENKLLQSEGYMV